MRAASRKRTTKQSPLLPNREFLSCREVLNWIAFGDAAEIYGEPDDDMCDAGLLAAYAYLVSPESDPVWQDRIKFVSSYQELLRRAEENVRLSHRTPSALYAEMKTRVDKQEAIRRRRYTLREIAKEKLSVAVAGGLEAHAVAGDCCRARSPDLFLASQLAGSNIPSGWYLKADVIERWPCSKSGSAAAAVFDGAQNMPAVGVKRGRKPEQRDRVVAQMLEDVRNGKFSLDQLVGLKMTALPDIYGASRGTCVQARKQVRSKLSLKES